MGVSPPHYITMLVILLSLFASAYASSVSVQYPLQDQLPLIARVNQTYSWSFSRETFQSSHNSSLEYTTSALPAWLSFDNSTLTFSGTPAPQDEGTPGIRVIATDPTTSDSASSSMTMCVTPYAAPELNLPVAKQFYATNPSLSSVFLLSPNSALNTSAPALRIPHDWSFSIGFQYDTFNASSSGNLYYAALRADGTPLPSWIQFNSQLITFNGVTPSGDAPMTVALALHASDQQGYSAGFVPFDIVVASHEVSLLTESLPTINITASTPFNFSLTSPDDFSGVMFDGQPIQPIQITSLDIDVSQFGDWLKYDSTTRTLSGMAPDNTDSGETDTPQVPATITTVANQTIHTEVALAVVPSYFSTATMPPILALPGQHLQFGLQQYFSNSSDLGTDVNLTAAFDPASAGSFLSFDSSSAELAGNVPANISGSYSHVTVTFTAYSHVTHSTSHACLPVSLSNYDYTHQKTGGGLSAAARAKLLLGLKIGFGVISGLVGLAFVLALFRRCAHVEDTALTGEEGTRAWTAEEMKWYGIGIEVDGKVTEGPQHNSPSASEKNVNVDQEAGPSTVPSPNPSLGATLHRVLTRTMSNPRSLASARSPQSPGMMRKGEFMGKIRSTARKVSDTYRGVSDMYKRSMGKRTRPVISKPTLIMTSDHRVSAMTGVPIEGLPFTANSNSLVVPPPATYPTPIPFEDMNLSQYAPSGMSSIGGSPSSSTDGRSIPRRRADFAPPRAKDAQAAQRQSVSSMSSDSSSRTHEAEAVVRTAARATSVRSGISSVELPRTPDAAGRPRLVPFTSASRVPVPKLPPGAVNQDAPIPGAVQTPHGGANAKRVTSQSAKVFRGVASAQKAEETQPDELSQGVQYVRALGDDMQSAGSVGPSPTGSFSVESSQLGHGRGFSSSGKIPIVPRMLARTGEQFKFRVPVSYSAGSPLTASGAQKKSKMLEARLMTGKPLPRFVKSDLNAVASGAGARVEKRVVEFWGVPTARDTGELNVGIYERESDKCVGRVIIEIVERS
ncbi:hypothetical protein WOLCODRAFT_164915 [Wolfiporia cocos MD-104 SS10]|uniref:Dystroglycan-type cadherin-like domain-containing protein n=1 Tax=Wolfiporia cocos (strain MD-104) TaxID=742152 RepID=A0A2H3K6N2_WOLCO|nr:hypothetical protein WOLCODRAFT_164915 [Wolfiporia cocos MD-104 SS10]